MTRKKAAILKVYIVDAQVKDEAAVLARSAGDPHVRVTPDTAYVPEVTLEVNHDVLTEETASLINGFWSNCC